MERCFGNLTKLSSSLSHPDHIPIFSVMLDQYGHFVMWNWWEGGSFVLGVRAVLTCTPLFLFCTLLLLFTEAFSNSYPCVWSWISLLVDTACRPNKTQARARAGIALAICLCVLLCEVMNMQWLDLKSFTRRQYDIAMAHVLHHASDTLALVLYLTPEIGVKETAWYIFLMIYSWYILLRRMFHFKILQTL